MKKYFKLLGVIALSVLLGGIIGSIISGLGIATAIPWAISWLVYLSFIHVPIILVFFLVTTGLFLLLRKILKKTDEKKIYIAILIIDAVIPFAFYAFLFSQGVSGRF